MTTSLPHTSFRKPKQGDKFITAFAENRVERTISRVNGYITDVGDMGVREVWMVESEEYPNSVSEIAYDILIGKWREWDGTF